jgi:hypothetical protein
MGYILGMSLMAAASLAVTLLAILLVILTRPRPRPLLWAFWLSALVINVGIGLAFLLVFRSKGTILGTTSTSVPGGVYVLVGVIALAAALFASTRRGRELIGRELEKTLAPSEPDDSVGGRLKAKADGVKTRAEDSLAAGSVAIAIVAGLFVAAPTPFQLTAVGEMVRQDYPFVLQLALLVVVSLVTYIVVEIPVVSYALRPETTAARVTAFAAWLDANKIQAAAALAAVIGVILVIKGLAFS